MSWRGSELISKAIQESVRRPNSLVEQMHDRIPRFRVTVGRSNRDQGKHDGVPDTGHAPFPLGKWSQARVQENSNCIVQS